MVGAGSAQSITEAWAEASVERPLRKGAFLGAIDTAKAAWDELVPSALSRVLSGVMPETSLTLEELGDAWPALATDERLEGFSALDRDDADDFFLGLPADDQSALLRSMPSSDRRLWFHRLPPDDAADVIQEFPEAERGPMLSLIDEAFRREILGLMAYAEDAAGGLMSPRFARLRPDMTVDEALADLFLGKK